MYAELDISFKQFLVSLRKTLYESVSLRKTYGSKFIFDSKSISTKVKLCNPNVDNSFEIENCRLPKICFIKYYFLYSESCSAMTKMSFAEDFLEKMNFLFIRKFSLL